MICCPQRRALAANLGAHRAELTRVARQAARFIDRPDGRARDRYLRAVEQARQNVETAASNLHEHECDVDEGAA